MLKAPPQDFRSGPIAAAAPHKPAEGRDPVDRLAKRRRLRRRLGDTLDGTLERLPCVRLPQDPTGRLGHHARQPGGVKHAPRQHALERQTALKALRRGALTRFKAAASVYERLRRAGKAPQVALTACRRKLLTILNAMVKHRTPWQQNYAPCS